MSHYQVEKHTQLLEEVHALRKIWGLRGTETSLKDLQSAERRLLSFKLLNSIKY